MPGKVFADEWSNEVSSHPNRFNDAEPPPKETKRRDVGIVKNKEQEELELDEDMEMLMSATFAIY